jgi:predicted GNAT family acetyltransferase
MSCSFELSSFAGASLNQISTGLSGALQSANVGKRKSMTDVVNNKAQHRYELTVEGHLAATYYKISDGVITFIHTEVPPELGGKGVGSALVKGALDQVRADGLKVIPQCPFVKAYIGKHAEYADLLLES